jgi:hypothetical protein
MNTRATLSEIHEQNRYNMRYRCPMCATMRQSYLNREHEPQELTTDTVRTILALKNIVNTTNDLELYLDAIKFLYDIKLKILLISDDDEELAGTSEFDEMEEELLAILNAVNHAQPQLSNWRRRRNGLNDDFDIRNLGMRVNLTLYRFIDEEDDEEEHLPRRDSNGMFMILYDMDREQVSIPETPTPTPPETPDYSPPPSIPGSPEILTRPVTPGEEIRRHGQISSRPRNNNSDSKHDYDDIDMRIRRNGTRHGRNMKKRRGGYKKSRKKKRLKGKVYASKKGKSRFKRKRKKKKKTRKR